MAPLRNDCWPSGLGLDAVELAPRRQRARGQRAARQQPAAAQADEEHAKAAGTRDFYREYCAVADLPAEFYLETVERVFQRHDLPRGEMTWRGRRVDPSRIRRTALLTVEGERDDICSVGQTLAAQDLCTGLRPYMRKHLVQAGVGHYGVFSGRRWQQQIYPLVRETIHLFDG
jgi:poly(3-hydroxybutyrate) depolymerase